MFDKCGVRPRLGPRGPRLPELYCRGRVACRPRRPSRGAAAPGAEPAAEVPAGGPPLAALPGKRRCYGADRPDPALDMQATLLRSAAAAPLNRR